MLTVALDCLTLAITIRRFALDVNCGMDDGIEKTVQVYEFLFGDV